MTDNEIELALETIALVLEDLKKTQEKQQATITAIEKALAEHAMRQTQRLGQEIEQEPVRLQCVTCGTVYADGVPPQVTQPEQEPVSHPVIAGALFDFMGWLTSRKERIVLSSADEASPAVDAIRDFAKMRGLSLDDAKVQDWNTTPPQRTWVNLTDEDRNDCLVEADPCECLATPEAQELMRCVEAKSRSKNT